MARTPIKDRSWVEINLNAFRHNLKQLKAFMKDGQSFMQIVKADAYGHGAYEIGRIAMEEGAVYLGVANAEEGKLIRIQGCKAPILVLSPSLREEIEDVIRYNLAVSVSDPDFAFAIEHAAVKAGTTVKVHLKIDSGMKRSGADPADFSSLYETTAALPHLMIEGLFSHFASSENDIGFSHKQLDSFFQTIEAIHPRPEFIHIANSSALVNGFYGESSMVRMGILSFGIYTHPDQCLKIDLKPVMTFKSNLAQIKKIRAGEGLGYNLSWTAKRDTVYAIVPVGYADGYDFLLSNRGKVAIDGLICDVIGRVSMDMICVDITDIADAAVGTQVTLLGASADEIRAESLSCAYGGSAYELLCQVGRRARRYYMENGEVSHSAPLARRDFVSSDFNDSKLNQIIQSAISQRLQSDEIGELISREILRAFFFNRDKDIHYRKDFVHSIRLEQSSRPQYWRAVTRLSFSKVLQNDYFIVACATSDEALRRYFIRNDVEYRWLMDDSFELGKDSFELTEVYVNNVKLEASTSLKDNCLELRCQHPELISLVGREVSFMINTISYYPKSSHQLSVFITELTHGVQVSLEYPESIASLEVVPVFSGQNRYPAVSRHPGSVNVSTKADQWVFPLSGVVFAY